MVRLRPMRAGHYKDFAAPAALAGLARISRNAREAGLSGGLAAVSRHGLGGQKEFDADPWCNVGDNGFRDPTDVETVVCPLFPKSNIDWIRRGNLIMGPKYGRKPALPNIGLYNLRTFVLFCAP